MLTINATPNSVTAGERVKLQANGFSRTLGSAASVNWVVSDGLVDWDPNNPTTADWDTGNLLPGAYTASFIVEDGKGQKNTWQTRVAILSQSAATPGDGVPVTMRPTATRFTSDLLLWMIIRATTERISFNNYAKYMDLILCGAAGSDVGLEPNPGFNPGFNRLRNKRFLPFNDTDAYRLLKVATEAFLIVNCGVALNGFGDQFLNDLYLGINDDATEALQEEFANKLHRMGLVDFDGGRLGEQWKDYLERVDGMADLTLPYLARIRNKLPEWGIELPVGLDDDADLPSKCHNLIKRKLSEPCLLELIWSYWHEEGMLVQAMNAISLRFQNVRGPGDGNPLAMMEIDPLRPLNNLIWGYIQDEQHRLTVLRRVYEYDHHYGLPLVGKAVPDFRPADSRSRFLEAFHNLLYLTAIFFKEDDDTTVIADAFPILHALKDVHFLLAEGAHNQFGDLPSTARQEMLMQQWILARPEFREFLPTRIMVAYPEPWMDRVDAMKSVQGWTDTSVLHFRNLGMFGERALLSIRYGNWGSIEDPLHARNWARFWRAEIQGYIHAYRAVTGVDLTAEITDSQQEGARYAPPSAHLLRRLEAQRPSLPAAGGKVISVGSGSQPARRSTQLAVPKRSR